MMENGAAAIEQEDRRVDALYDGQTALTAGTLKIASTFRRNEALFDGLRVIVVETGKLECGLPGHDRFTVAGPALCLVWNRRAEEGEHMFSGGQTLRYTAVSLTPTFAAHVSDGSAAHRAGSFLSDNPHIPALRISRIPESIRGVCSQIAACPLKGAGRSLFLTGKALELTGIALENTGDGETGATAISLADAERIRAAKDLLDSNLAHPPALAGLALAVGLNSRKLREGFSHIFGMSPNAYLHEARMDAAYRLLSSGNMQIATVAYRIGFTPAHFSVAFKKHFGVSPKALRGHADI
ncbi:AraC family transcriptional regulator [uncultured Martelella sp.]|uniref:helix-turn-helix transcriptional regulator n=1 Tax=uncultured Martelella sp. TaxID=392331 RepID=UPI0029C6A274|nr:AraC family transcriptional regulator [uncultured Martelella sp.]